MTGRRGLTAVVVACAVAGGLALSAGGRTWATATVARSAPLPPVTEELAGRDLAGPASACALLVLAAAVAVVAARGRARQLVGLLAAVAGGTLLWSGLRRLTTTPGLADLPDGAAAGATAVEWSRSAAWPSLTAAAGALAVAAGVLTVVRGVAWSGMGRRYERGPAPAGDAAPATARSREDLALDAWRALDRGEDPTAGEDPPAGGAPAAGERPAR